MGNREWGSILLLARAVIVKQWEKVQNQLLEISAGTRSFLQRASQQFLTYTPRGMGGKTEKGQSKSAANHALVTLFIFNCRLCSGIRYCR